RDHVVREGGSLPACDADGLHFVPERILRRDPRLHHAAPAEDDPEQVVEVVGDAAREAADGLELLRLDELAFGGRALSHLLLQQLVRALELRGALLDALFELVAAPAELLLDPLPREEIRDLQLFARGAALSARTARTVALDDGFDVSRRRHHE